MSESQEPRDEQKELQEALVRARTTTQFALIGLIFAIGLLAALVVPAKTTNVNLRGHLVLSARPPRGAEVGGIELRGTAPRSANPAAADLSHATLTGVNLSGANLAGVSFRGARLRDVNLSNANLAGADLTGAVYDVETRWPNGFDPRASGAAPGR